MNLIPKWLWRRKSAASTLDLFREIYGGRASKSGQAVTWRTALEASTALACARVIAEGLSQVPFKLYRREGASRIEALDHPAYALLSARPNEWQTSFEFREQIALHLVFAGQAFVWKNQSRGRLLELLVYEPQLVTVERDGAWGRRYKVTLADGTRQEIPADEMWHLKGPSWDGVIGLEGVKLAREAIGLALATEEHGARLFANGAQPGGILTTTSILTEEQRKALRSSWNDLHEGGGNAHKTAILWGGLDWKPTASDNERAQFLETRRFQVEEICRAFRVMPIMVGHADKSATYASAEQMFLAHVIHTLMPWYARVEQSADNALLTDKERAAGFYFAFQAAGLMRGDYKSRQEGLQIQRRNGVINADEWRALEEMNPMAGEGGDVYVVEANMAKLESVGEAPEPVEPEPMVDEEARGELAEQRRQLDRLAERQPTINIAPPAVNVKVEPQQINVAPAAVNVKVEPQSINVQPANVEPVTVNVSTAPADTEQSIETDSKGNIKRVVTRAVAKK